MRHRRVKDQFARTSRKDFTTQVVQIGNRQDTLEILETATSSDNVDEPEEIKGDPTVHHTIAKDQKRKFHYADHTRLHPDDQAFQVGRC